MIEVMRSNPVIIIQARMNSTRLPGKMLMLLGMQSLLECLVTSMARVKNKASVVVATSDQAADDPIEAACRGLDCSVYRGTPNNVLARFIGAMSEANASSAVRVCGDSPFLSRLLVEEMIERHINGTQDITTNIQTRTFPKGMSVEVFERGSLERAASLAVDSSDLEHVTPVFYRHSDQFVIENIQHEPSAGDVEFSVDTKEDYQTALALRASMSRDSGEYSVSELLLMKDQQARSCGPVRL